VAQLIEQRIVGVVADLGIVEHVVAVGVVLERGAQLLRARARPLGRGAGRSGHLRAAVGARSSLGRGGLLGGAHLVSGAAGTNSSSRSERRSRSRLGRWVRSKWIGVIAIRPAATAARSVPGSSSKPGSEP